MFNNKKIKYLKAFSLVEIIIVVFILSLLGITVFKFQYDVFYLNDFLSQNLASQEKASRALKMMTSEIRTASPSSLGTYPLLETATSSFIFYSNIDADSHKERVRYFIEDGNLKKGVTKAVGDPVVYDTSNEVVTEIVDNVLNTDTSVFTYYNSDYDGTSEALQEPFDISEVSLVKVTLIIGTDPMDSSMNFVLSTQVSMRNLNN